MNCKQCGEDLKNKRDDAIFCNVNCKQKHYKRKRKIKNEIEYLNKQIESEKDIIAHFENVIKQEEKKKLQKIEDMRAEVDHLDKRIDNLNNILSFTPQKLLNVLFQAFNKDPFTYSYEIQVCYSNDTQAKKRLISNARNKYFERIEHLSTKKSRLERKCEIRTLALLDPQDNGVQTEARQSIEKSKEEIKKLKSQLSELLEIDLDRLPIVPSKSRKFAPSKKVSSVRAYSGREISELDFRSIILKEPIGQFLGELERNKCAIALTGDSGAGKSHFSFLLADGFLEVNLSVGYFTLESGFSSKFKKFASRYSSNKRFRAFEEGGLSDIRTEAKNFDCIIIDSYSKISDKASDFESLRQDFPNTFFIVIFQKTTDGKIRGGSSILFNSTATIDIKIMKNGTRIAFMKKSRYDTENYIYSITEKRLLKEDKLPINWKEFE